MRQLDLFGSLFDNPAVPEKKEEPKQVQPPITEEKKGKQDNEFAIEQHSILQPEVIKHIEPEKPASEITDNKNSLFFTDGKIGVKVKAKPAAESVEKIIKQSDTLKTDNHPIKKAAGKANKTTAKKVVQKRGRKSYKDIDAEAGLIQIPEDDILFQKQYYPISEVAQWFNVNTSLLRFWENEFDILKPRKNRKGDRMFRPEDVKNIQLIYDLLRQKKYSIEGAKEYLKSNKTKADAQIMLTQTLTKLKNFLLDIKTNLH